MKPLHTRTAQRSVAAIASLLVLAVLLVAPSGALAAVSVKKASLSAQNLAVEGSGAQANATITVSSPESTATGRADGRGDFKFGATAFRASTCKATVGDGASSAVVTLSGCTPAPTPPPPPPGSTATAPTSLSLSPASLSKVGNLSVAGVTFPANPVTPLRVTVQSSHPTLAQVPASVDVTNFSDPANPVASFTVTYVAAVTVTTPVTISVTGGGVTRTAVLTLNPPPAPTLAPGPRGPGFVGSDFTTFATLGTTISLGPNGVGPIRAQVVAGQLPDGLSLVQPGCVMSTRCPYVAIVGIPTRVQTSSFTVSATDAIGQQATGTFTITINPPLTLSITPEQWAPVTVGNFSNLWIDGGGGTQPYRWARTAGQLPPGMSLIQDNPSGPLVRVGGTPTTAGTFDFTLRLTDATGAAVSRTFSVVVG